MNTRETWLGRLAVSHLNDGSQRLRKGSKTSGHGSQATVPFLHRSELGSLSRHGI